MLLTLAIDGIWSLGGLVVVFAVAGSVAGGAAWLEFGGDGVFGLLVGRVVVEFE